MGLTIFISPRKIIFKELKNLSESEDNRKTINLTSNFTFNHSINNFVAQNYSKDKSYHIFYDFTFEDFFENTLIKEYLYDFSKSKIAKKLSEKFNNEYTLQLLYIDKKGVEDLYNDLTNTFINYKFKEFLKEDFYYFYKIVENAIYWGNGLFIDDSLTQNNFDPSNDFPIEIDESIDFQTIAINSCDIYYKQITKKDSWRLRIAKYLWKKDTKKTFFRYRSRRTTRRLYAYIRLLVLYDHHYGEKPVDYFSFYLNNKNLRWQSYYYLYCFHYNKKNSFDAREQLDKELKKLMFLKKIYYPFMKLLAIVVPIIYLFPLSILEPLAINNTLEFIINGFSDFILFITFNKNFFSIFLYITILILLIDSKTLINFRIDLLRYEEELFITRY